MTPDTLDDILAEAESRAESLLEREEFDGTALETLDDLADVADEAEDLLSTVDVRELLDALDVSDVPEAVELSDVPDAIEERAPRKAVKLRKLLRLADLSQVLDSTDLRQFRREKQELEAEIDDLTDDGGGGRADDGSSGAGGGGGDEGSVIGGSGDGPTGDDGLLSGLDAGGALADDLDGEERSEVMEAAVQSTVDDAVKEFRDGLLEAHDRLAAMREKNQERTSSVDRQPSSSNPTAFSSMPASRIDVGSGSTRHSTVPSTVRHSNATGRERVYGDRFEEGSDDG